MIAIISKKMLPMIGQACKNSMTGTRPLNLLSSLGFSLSFPHGRNIYGFSDKQPNPDNSPRPSSKPSSEQGEPNTETKMNAVGEGSASDQDKDKQGTGFVPSQFGNYMLIISAIALLLAYGFMEIQTVRAENKKKKTLGGTSKVTAVGKAQIGGQWELIDTNGKLFSNKTLEGSYYLIYFGFTNCPDICPNSLTKLTKAVKKVKKSKQASFFDLKTVFVSVDPDRDTSEKMTKFLNFFDPEMIGITGKSNDDPALRDCMKKFRIYASKLQFETEDTVVKGRKAYTIDHTILTYLFNDKNEYIAHLGANLGEHELYSLILEKIIENEKEKLGKLKVQ